MEKTVVIICDGQFPKTEFPRYLIRTADFVICCDGALTKFLRNSKSIYSQERLPDLVIGDMDTLSASMHKYYCCIPRVFHNNCCVFWNSVIQNKISIIYWVIVYNVYVIFHRLITINANNCCSPV